MLLKINLVIAKNTPLPGYQYVPFKPFQNKITFKNFANNHVTRVIVWNYSNVVPVLPLILIH